MKAQVEEVSSIKKKISIEVEPDDYKKELESAYRKLQKEVQIKGFRKGKVPREILEKYYKERTESEVLTHLVEHSYVWALGENQITPVSQPKILDLKNLGEGLTYVAEVEVKPQVEVKKYKEIKLEKMSVEVAEDEIAKEFEALRNAHAQITPVAEGTVVTKGQITVIDFLGKIDGQAFAGGEGKGVSVEVGAKRFLEDFEEALPGMKKGESKKIDVTFPKEYPTQDLAGKKAQFEITLNDIKEKILPELSDDFARDLGNFESLAQVKDKLKEHMGQQKEALAKADLSQQILDHLIKESPFEVPESMVEIELDSMLENAKRQLIQQRLSFEQAGITVEGFRSQNREASLRRVKAFLLFDAIGKTENIQASVEELRNRIAQIAQSIGQTAEVVERHYYQNNMLHMLQAQILEEKVLDFLIAAAKIEEVKNKEALKKSRG